MRTLEFVKSDKLELYLVVSYAPTVYRNLNDVEKL